MLFGVFAIVGMVIGTISDWVKEGQHDKHAMEMSEKNGYDIFVDYHGGLRNLKTAHPVIRYRTTPARGHGMGDLIEEDCVTGIKTNKTVEKAMTNFDKDAERAKQFGRTVLPYGYDRHVKDYVPGARYIDIDTKEVYVKVYASNKDFFNRDERVVSGDYYMKPDTMELVRLSDDDVRDADFREREKKINNSKLFVNDWNNDPEFRKLVTIHGDLFTIITKEGVEKEYE